MQFSITAGLLALAASVAALQVTSPAQGAVLDLTKSNTITWSTVSTDQTSFNIVLVNQHVNPSVNVNIASNVQASAGSYNVPAQSGVAAGDGYQFNLVSTVNAGILAQSQQFTVGSSGSSTSGGSSVSTTSGGTATPVTSLSIPTGSTAANGTSPAAPTGSSNSSSTFSSPSLPKSTGGAAKLPVVACAGSILMGLFALIL